MKNPHKNRGKKAPQDSEALTEIGTEGNVIFNVSGPYFGLLAISKGQFQP